MTGGLIGFGGAQLVGDPGLAVPVLAGCMVGAGGSAALGVRAGMRRRLGDQVVAALAPLQGLRIPDRGSVRMSRWRGPGVGFPRRITVRYAPGVSDQSPDWRAEILDVVERRLLVEASIGRHDRRRCRLVIHNRSARGEGEPDLVHPLEERAIAVLSELLGPTAEVTTRFDDDGELRRLEVEHEAGARIAAAGYRMRVERVVSAMLPGRWRAQWQLTEDTVTFEVRPTLTTLVAHVPSPITRENLYRLPLAVDEDRRLAVWDLQGTGPHLMVVGKTGSGKTVLINGVVMEAALRGWRVWIADPKRIEFMGLRDWPNVQIVATTVEDQIAMISTAHREMEDRYAAIEAGGDESDFEPLVIVLDEYRNFMRQVGAWYAGVKKRGMPTKCPVFEQVAAIAEKGRSGRVHLVLGTQRPDAEFLTGSMRDNFDSRVSLGRLSPQGAQMMWESPYLGVSVPRKIKGRGTAVTEDDRVDEVQALWTPDPRRAARQGNAEDLALLAALRPAAVTHGLLEVVLGSEGEDEDDVGWRRVVEARLVPADPGSPRTVADPTTGGPPPSGAVVLARDETPSDELVDGAVDRPREQISDDLDEAFAPEQRTRAGRLSPGDLVLVDDAVWLWGIVESVEEDVTDPDGDLMCIEWRGDEDEAGSLSVDASSHVRVRRPLDDVEAGVE